MTMTERRSEELNPELIWQVRHLLTLDDITAVLFIVYWLNDERCEEMGKALLGTGDKAHRWLLAIEWIAIDISTMCVWSPKRWTSKWRNNEKTLTYFFHKKNKMVIRCPFINRSLVANDEISFFLIFLSLSLFHACIRSFYFVNTTDVLFIILNERFIRTVRKRGTSAFTYSHI